MSSAFRGAINHALGVLRSGDVVAQRWDDGRLVFYPRGTRLGQQSGAPNWERVTHGTVLAVTTVYEHSHPDYQTDTPFTLVLVDAEGARLICRLSRSAPVPAVGSTVSLSAQVTEAGPRTVAS